MLSIGLNPYGSGGYVKQNTKKAPSKPRLPRPKVPESERRRSSRARPERLTYDEWSDDERPRQRSRGSAGRRARNNRLVELSEEQRAALDTFDMEDFEAFASASFTKPRHRRPERDHRFICTQVDGARRRAPHLRRQPAPGHPPGHEARVRRGRPLRLGQLRLAGRRHLPQGRAGDDAVGRSAQSKFRASRHRRDDLHTGRTSARSSRTRASSRTRTAATTATAGSSTTRSASSSSTSTTSTRRRGSRRRPRPRSPRPLRPSPPRPPTR